MIDKKDINTFFLVILYALSFYAIQLFFFKTLMLTNYPSAHNLAGWDAAIYQYIMKSGYVHGTPGNTGFFFLFSLIWRITHLGVRGIVFLNLIFFATGATIILKSFPLSTNEKLLWLSTPSLYFMFVPYTEALFFLLASFLFYGIIHKKKLLICISLLLISWTRSTTIFFIPAFLAMELLTNDKKNIRKTVIEYLIIYVLPLLIGLAFFIWYQYLVTGIWFEYFKQQGQYLGHIFSIPVLPFYSLEGDRLDWLDALGLFIGLTSLIILITRIYKWIANSAVENDKILIFSLGYLAIVPILIFFNPKWGSYTTNIMGMHRYTMATPFFLVFLHYLLNKCEYLFRDYIIIFVSTNIVWLSFGSYKHILQFLFFNFNTLLIILYMQYAQKKASWLLMIIFAVNVFIQISLFQQFINVLYPD